MPKKKQSQDRIVSSDQQYDISTSTMIAKMASADLSPLSRKRRTLREVVNQARQRTPTSSSHGLVTAVKSVSTLENSVFINDRLSRKVTENLSAQDVRDLKLVFDIFDVDKSGFIDYDELRKACKILGFSLSKDEIEKLLTDVDIDKSGQIDLNEFLEFIISRQGDDRDIFSEISQGFKLFDHNHTGKITSENLKWACRETGVFLSDQDIKGMIYEADKNGDNEIDMDEFIGIMLQTNLFV